MSDGEPTPPLPELHASVLDEPTLARLFEDLAHHAEVLAVTLKAAAGAYAGAGAVTLDAAREALSRRAVRGAQIHYRWSGETWCDTLLVVEGGWRIVRMRS